MRDNIKNINNSNTGLDTIRRERWRITPEAVPTVRRNCSKCKEKREFINSMKFRVNANGKNVDVWLIYRCEKCSTTWNMSIYERTPVSSVLQEEYAGFLENDRTLAEAYGRRMDLFVKNRAEAVIPEGGYRTEVEADGNADENSEVVKNGFRLIELVVPFPVTLRLDGLVADRLGVSRSMVKRWCSQGIMVKLDEHEMVWKKEEKLCREKVRNGMRIGIGTDLPVSETGAVPQAVKDSI